MLLRSYFCLRKKMLTVASVLVFVFVFAFLLPHQTAQANPLILSITIEAGITQVTTTYVAEAVRAAEERKATALLIQLDTPGGLLEATREITKTILAADVPVICYVAPSGARAGSAGVFLVLASHIAAMAPATHIGAAHPVDVSGEDIKGDMRKKIENDTVAWARSLASSRGRNADWAERAVRESLSISETEALVTHIIDIVAPDARTLLSKIDGTKVILKGSPVLLQTQNARIERFPRSLSQQVGDWLSNPNITYLLLIVGILGIFIETTTPGLILPGIVGALCLLVVFGIQVLPINWMGAALILAAGVLLILEIYVTSFGILTLLALVSLVTGSSLLFDVHGASFSVAASVKWSVAAAVALCALIIGALLIRTKRQGPTSGIDAMSGELATVFEDIAPNKPGRVLLRGSYWTAKSENILARGEHVRVVRMEGNTAFVAPNRHIL